MSRQSAIRFEHRSSFVDFVRQQSADKGSQPFSLYACEGGDPEGPAHVYYLTRAGSESWLGPVVKRGWVQVKVAVDREGGQVQQLDGVGQGIYALKAWRDEARLPYLIGPTEAQGDKAPGVVVLWCKGEEAFQRLIGMSLNLGCDRLQYAVMMRDDGGSEWLLRAERVSYYVIDTALNDLGTLVYTPAGLEGGLFVQWGSVHPLEALIEGGEGGSAVFMDGLGVGARSRRVALPAWRDVYQLTRFELGGLEGDEQWTPSELSAGQFVVKLRLMPTHAAREPQIWLMPAADQPRVERLLHAIPEPDLDNLQFTAQETPQGERFLIIRERHTGVGREYIDFEGIQLGPWAGYPNLMLPVDRDLEPQLRKDRYRALFDLTSGYQTLLFEMGGVMRLVHVQERSYRPLREFVDYIIGVEGQALEQILGQTVFEFQNYRYAQAAWAPRAPKKAEREEAELEEPEWEAGVDEAPAVEPVKKGKAKAAPAMARPAKVEKRTPSELESAEIECETALILKGQSAERWVALAQVKEELDKHREAAMCWAEALWLTRDPQAANDLEGRVIRALERSEGFGLEGTAPKDRARRLREQIAQQDSDPGWVWLWVTHGARHLRDNPGDEKTHSWLAEGHRLLTARREALRKKDRWALWNHLVAVNRDAVEQTRIREEIVEELNQRGLRPMDVPQFIQNRIYQSRLIDDGGLSGGAEARAAMRILERVQAEVHNARDESVRLISDAILAYGFERLGDRARAAQHYQEAERTFQGSSGLTGIERAWIALYLGASQEAAFEGSGQDWLERFERLFRQHRGGDLYSSELETIQKHLLERATSDSPTKFLDAENFRSLYPSSQKYAKGQALRHEIEGMIQRGEFEFALKRLQSTAEQASTRKLNLDTRELAWLLQHVVVKTMRRIGRAAEGTSILHRFEEGRVDPQEDTMGGFYPTLYMITLGEGFLDLGEDRRGMDLVCGAVRSAWTSSQRLQWLDHLDMLSAALNGIEIAPLEHRIDAVSEVLEALFLDRPHPTDSDRPQYRPIKLRLLDHCVEVGLSKEKLSLKRYKNYLEEDEFHVRQRIITEKLNS